MKNNFLLKDEFKNWLIETAKITEASARSYLSYVSGADKLISITTKDSTERKNLFTILQAAFDQHNIERVKATILYVIDELSRKNADKVFGRPRKTLHNYRSGLYSYLEFLTEQPVPYEDISEEEFETPVPFEDISDEEFETPVSEIDIQVVTDTGESLTAISDDKVYLKNDLVKNFSLRIKTQDRFYGNIFFPIRFITRLYSKRNERNVFNDWLNHLLNSIIIFIEGDKTTFADISALTIANNKVYITLNGTERIAYTKRLTIKHWFRFMFYL